ncbi:MAG: toxin [Tatlockia sp.]|jgi:RHS repeat-associated protein|nr:toxin [Tatlockia sp.]
MEPTRETQYHKATSTVAQEETAFISNPSTISEPKDGVQNNALPVLSIPKGGGAVRSIGEKFSVNPVTGTCSLTVPIVAAPGRSGFGPQLSLSYDSGAGNGPFGFGWNISLPAITRQTNKGLPRYNDSEESDVFILSEAEDLVPVFKQNNQGEWVHNQGEWVRNAQGEFVIHDSEREGFTIRLYRPRIEGLFARIERWTRISDGDTHWRSITKDNITTVYGKSENSRIADPGDSRRIFSWLICESHDDKGNAIVYTYETENDKGVSFSAAHEANRMQQGRSTNRYLKRIKYGNLKSRLVELNLSQEEWMFEIVFDYGEHSQNNPAPNDAGDWLCRKDPFSFYRSGFEVRTYRRCERVLLFHHFSELGQAPTLIRSTDFRYNYTQHNGYSLLNSVTQTSYVRQGDGYKSKSIPPTTFNYSAAPINETTINATVEILDNEYLRGLPLNNSSVHLLDLDGEGLPGIMIEQSGSWYYLRNLSPITFESADSMLPQTKARFAPPETIAARPTSVEAGMERYNFLDLDGNGRIELVQFSGSLPGIFERNQQKNWKPFQPFVSLPTIDWNDPDLIFVDLTGDGLADLLITDKSVFTWYPSRGHEGFGAAEHSFQGFDEKQAPVLIFADKKQAIFFADMSGDGLSDVVRVGATEICYWANLGYGRFGAKITMDSAPHLDTPELFDQRRVRLADIDGSGTIDLIYLAAHGPQIYFNQSGASWSESYTLDGFPPIDNLAAVQATDFLGIGTACLVWSSPLPNDAHKKMRYVDLMGGQKPHLLTKVENNLGAVTDIHYAPSTKFYLDDELEGKPWTTKLHFPVHVVERVEVYDRISSNRFVTRYAYHHGFYDGVEREFRGFGMVERWDSEEFSAFNKNRVLPPGNNWDESSHVPPTLTKTWFHTGAYFEDASISKQFEHEYYHEGDHSLKQGELTEEQFKALVLPDTVLPDDLIAEEAREACRALKGTTLRQEVYALDNREESDRPYTVSERNYTIRMQQPRGKNRHGVFFTHGRETIDYHYERKLYEVAGQKLADPRVAHRFTLEADDYGNELRSVSTVYGRRFDAPDGVLTSEDKKKQKQTLLICTENRYTNPIIFEPDNYRTPLPSEIRTWELINIEPETDQTNNSGPKITRLFNFDELKKKTNAASDGNHDLAFEDVKHIGAKTNKPYRRLVEHVRTLYRKDNLTGLLPLGKLEPLALAGETYKLALTLELLANIYQRGQENLLPANPTSLLKNKGGYVHSEGDLNWWIPSGRVFYHPKDIEPEQELKFAKEHFFLSHRALDPFFNELFISYDDKNKFLPVETRDSLGNIVRAEYDYRVLQPKLITDPNGNRTEVTFGILGFVVGTAVMGKTDDVGDSLAGFTADLDLATMQAFAAEPDVHASTLLKNATTRIIYDVERFKRCGQPSFAATLARETHVSDLQPGQQTKIQITFTYSDGFGRELQTKIQAEKGDAPRRASNIAVTGGAPLQATGDVKPGTLILENGHLSQTAVEKRWVGKGRTVYNNKGQPVKQYEPFFSSTHLYEEETEMTDAGVSSVLFYDPVGRVITNLHPDNTYEKALFDPWRQETWDVNDTVALDPRTDADIADFVSNYFESQPDAWKTWRAERINENYGETPEQRKAEKAAVEKADVHAGTPAIAFLDTLGRTFLTVAHNKFKRREENNEVIVDERHLTRSELDIEGKPLAIVDARGLRVMEYLKQKTPGNNDEIFTVGYDVAGNLLYQKSMDAGERWVLNDITGKPIMAWDSRGQTFRNEYDELRRPVASFVQGFDADNRNREIQFEKIVYGDAPNNGLSDAKKAKLNLRGKIYKHFDTAGVVTNLGRNPATNDDESFDFKGNLIRNTRQLLVDYKKQPNWAANTLPALEQEVFIGSTQFDAFNRAIQIVAPHGNRTGTKFNAVRPGYNEANLLERVDVWLELTEEPSALLNPNSATNTVGVKNIDYDAKGQRTGIEYKNSVKTKYTYDSETFRLRHLETLRRNERLQDLHYSYDPVGNITSIRDTAQQTIIFRNRQVTADNNYVYDAIYRLVEASGREHLGLLNNQRKSPTQPDAFNLFHANLEHPGDGKAMGNYREEYVYDEVGNILVMRHKGSDPNHPGWKQCYRYAIDSNQLLSTSKPSNAQNPDSACAAHYGSGPIHPNRYTYDEHGNMISMPHLPLMSWDFKDRLHVTQQQVVNNGGAGEKTFYVYDAAGQRVRKVTETQNGTRKEERICLGGLEMYRKYNGNGQNLALERETLHVMDDKRRIAIIETRTFLAAQHTDQTPRQLIRYQFSNHLGSVALELNDQAQVISYEEYYPYGSTSYQAMNQSIKAAAKRYRYTGKERDEETGLYYHGARYYAPWIGRWASSDPIGIRDSVNTYMYCRNAPIVLVDPNGKKPFDPQEGNEFRKWLLYGNDTPWKDAVTNDKNLENVQVGIAVATVATVVALGTGGASVALGATAIEAGVIGGGSGGMASAYYGAGIQGRLPTMQEVLTNTIVGAVTGGGIAAIESKVIPAIVAKTVPKPNVPPPVTPEPALPAPTPETTPVKKMELDPVSSSPKKDSLANVPNFNSEAEITRKAAKHGSGVTVKPKGELRLRTDEKGQMKLPDMPKLRVRSDYKMEGRFFFSGRPKGVMDAFVKGEHIRFDPKTGYYGVLNTKTGKVEAFYKPDKGAEWFHQQVKGKGKR